MDNLDKSRSYRLDGVRYAILVSSDGDAIYIKTKPPQTYFLAPKGSEQEINHTQIGSMTNEELKDLLADVQAIDPHTDLTLRHLRSIRLFERSLTEGERILAQSLETRLGSKETHHA